MSAPSAIASTDLTPQRPAKLSKALENLKRVAQFIGEMAVRLIFIVSSMLVAAFIVPIDFFAVVLPVVGFAATVLSSLFFTKEEIQPILGTLPTLIRTLRPIDQPPGLRGTINNCFMNSIVQFLEAAPEVAAWIREPLPTDKAKFTALLKKDYDCADKIIQDFNRYSSGLAGDIPPIPKQFLDFLSTYNPLPADIANFNPKIDYPKLYVIKEACSKFYAGYDEEKKTNPYSYLDLVDTQDLRLAIRKVVPTITENGQEDAAEVLRSIIDLLPRDQKIQITETRTYNGANLPAHLIHPVPKSNFTSSLQIDLFRNDFNVSFKGHLEENESIRIGVVEYPAKNVRTFDHTPSALFLQLKRFAFDPVTGTKYKIKDDVTNIPNQLQLPLTNGSKQNFRLVGSIRHLGETPEGGHYVTSAIETKKQEKFHFDDERVKPLTQEKWDDQVKQSYILCYLREPV